MVDEVEQPVVGPLDVLEYEDQRVAGGQPLEEPPPGLEEVLAAHVAASPAPTSARSCGATLSSPNSSCAAASAFFAGHLGRVVVEDLALRLHRVRERRVRGVPVGEASTAAPVHDLRQPLHVVLELGDQP